MTKLTAKQQRFVDEYLIDLNATRAYRVAYTGVKNDAVASVNASRLLANAKVKPYISEQLEKINNEKVADAQEVMEYLTKGMRMEIYEEVVVVEGMGEGCSSASTVQKQISARDATKCAELLAKRYGILTDKIKLDANVAVTNELKNILTQMSD